VREIKDPDDKGSPHTVSATTVNGIARQHYETPGLIGGLGEAAHQDLLRKILQVQTERGATTDQHRFNYVLFSNTQIPDRTGFLQGKNDSPVPALVQTALALERAGVDSIVMVCNTAHVFYDEVQRQLNLPLLHLIRIAAWRIAKECRLHRRPIVGVLATSGTLAAGLYHMALRDKSLRLVAPKATDQLQQGVMEAIYSQDFGVKSVNEPTEAALLRLKKLIEWEVLKGASILVAGCTELSILFAELAAQGQLPVPWVDPLRVLAETLWDFTHRHGRFEALQQLDQSEGGGKDRNEAIIHMSENVE
jgi:aspartate racemase